MSDDVYMSPSQGALLRFAGRSSVEGGCSSFTTSSHASLNPLCSHAATWKAIIEGWENRLTADDQSWEAAETWSRSARLGSARLSPPRRTPSLRCSHGVCSHCSSALPFCFHKCMQACAPRGCVTLNMHHVSHQPFIITQTHSNAYLQKNAKVGGSPNPRNCSFSGQMRDSRVAVASISFLFDEVHTDSQYDVAKSNDICWQKWISGVWLQGNSVRSVLF